jgi:hypothetical protein
MTIILNIEGLAMLFLGGLIFAGIEWVSGNNNIAGVIAFIAIFLMDIIYRAKQSGSWIRFVNPFKGGHVFYIAAWMWGVIILIASIAVV